MRLFSGLRGLMIVGAAIFLLAAAPASADPRKGSGEFGFDFGFSDVDKDFGDPGGRFQLRLGYFFSDVIQLEGQASIIATNEADEPDALDGKLYTYFVNAVANFHPRQNLVPYFLLGVGGARLDVGFAEDDSVAYQIAGGSRFMGREGKFGFRAELGWIWEDTFNESSTNFSMLFGLTWTLGQAHDHTVPQNKFTQLGYHN